MDRSYEFLLNKYKTKQPGEQWTNRHEVEYIREYRYQQRTFMLEGIINRLHGNFVITKKQKNRMNYLIRHLDFNMPLTEEQYIVMIIIYVKLETNNNARVRDYKRLLNHYEMNTDNLVSFLIHLNKYHINKIPLN